MAAELPSKFVDLNTALTKTVGSEVNLIGVVSDHLPASKSRGSDWMCTFTIADKDYGRIGDVGNEGLKVRFFKPTPSEMPPISGKGDVVLLRNMRIKQWNGITMAMSSHGSSWLVFSSSDIPNKDSSDSKRLRHMKEAKAPLPTQEEMLYAREICNSFDRSSFTSNPMPLNESRPPTQTGDGLSALSGKREKFSLVKDMTIKTYYDIVAEVVKLYPSNGKVDLYVSDYTDNQCLYLYEWGQNEDEDSKESREGDEFSYIRRSSKNSQKWPGPFGKLTLPITLWPPHSYSAQEKVKENDIVFLRNVHVRLDQDSKMVGSLHYDKRDPDRVDITLLKERVSPRVTGVLQRKQKYVEKFNRQRDEFVNEARASKNNLSNNSNPLSKNAQKRKRQKERQQAQKNEKDASSEPLRKKRRSSDAENITSLPLPASKKSSALNPNVHCANHLVPITPLSNIVSFDAHGNKTPKGTSYTLPFQNLNTRTTACIIDFFPPDLADFAVPVQRRSKHAASSGTGSDSDSDSDGASSDSSNNSNLQSSSRRSHAASQENEGDSGDEAEARRWEWRFALVLSDPKATIKSGSEEPATLTAYVCGADAECLLKLDASDLRRSEQDLVTLREKMFLLWGDLEERKMKQWEEEKEGESVGTEAGALANCDAAAKDGAEVGKVLAEIDGNRGTSAGPKKAQWKGRPFECCLKEYGVKVPNGEQGQSGPQDSGGDENGDGGPVFDWARRWRMFGCTIV